MAVLITGGAGYIGSHTALTFLLQGHEVIVVDNLVNSHSASLQRVQELAGKPLTFYHQDYGDRAVLQDVFSQHSIDCVVHFAGFKAVGESTEKPLSYYKNNVAKTLDLCDLMQAYKVKNLVFSSSATVYGDPQSVPITEDQRTQPTNPYGRTKLMIEEILRDICASDASWKVALLRYFNPIGAHESGQIGEDPNGIPNNLLPYIAQVASGKLARLRIWGDDYDTPDGTGVRDYIHVMDLAEGHLKAYEYLSGLQHGECETFNLGTGKGYSVKEVRDAFERISGRAIPYDVHPRRAGDIACCYANADKANQVLGWACRFELEDMIEDAWRWQSQNPSGFEV